MLRVKRAYNSMFDQNSLALFILRARAMSLQLDFKRITIQLQALKWELPSPINFDKIQKQVSFVYLKVNTFQAVIVSDDQKAYVFFLYDKIEWLSGEASDGVAAQVGYMFTMTYSIIQVICFVLMINHNQQQLYRYLQRFYMISSCRFV